MVQKMKLIFFFFTATRFSGLEGLTKDEKKTATLACAITTGVVCILGLAIGLDVYNRKHGCMLYISKTKRKRCKHRHNFIHAQEQNGTSSSNTTNEHFSASTLDGAPVPAPATRSIPVPQHESSVFRGRGQLERDNIQKDFRTSLIEDNYIASEGMAEGRAPLHAKTFTVEEIAQVLVARLKRERADVWQFMRKTYCPAIKIRD